MNKNIIYEVPSDRNVWVVRASGGDFVPHFRKAGIVAIGHLDILDLPDTASVNQTYVTEDLAKALQTAHLQLEIPKSKRATSAAVNQVIKFTEQMDVGDLVITLDSGLFSIGRVIGHPYIDKDPVRIVHQNDKDRYTEMDFHMRREVNWGPVLSRSSLPYAIERSLTAHQTVFNLNKSLIYIHHLFYPVFVFNEKIHFSAKIRQKENIDNYSMAQFLALLSELPALAKAFSDHKIANISEFDEVFSNFRIDGSVSVTTKAAFMSEGDIWGQVALEAFKQKDVLWFYIAYSAIFGSKIIGWEGAINNKTVQRLTSMAVQLVQRRGGDRLMADLKMKMPSHDTAALEDDSKDAEPLLDKPKD